MELNRVFQYIDTALPSQGDHHSTHNVMEIDPWNFFQVDTLPQEETNVQEEFTPSKPSTLPYIPDDEEGGFRSRITMRPPRDHITNTPGINIPISRVAALGETERTQRYNIGTPGHNASAASVNPSYRPQTKADRFTPKGGWANPTWDHPEATSGPAVSFQEELNHTAYIPGVPGNGAFIDPHGNTQLPSADPMLPTPPTGYGYTGQQNADASQTFTQQGHGQITQLLPHGQTANPVPSADTTLPTPFAGYGHVGQQQADPSHNHISQQAGFGQITQYQPHGPVANLVPQPPAPSIADSAILQLLAANLNSNSTESEKLSLSAPSLKDCPSLDPHKGIVTDDILALAKFRESLVNFFVQIAPTSGQYLAQDLLQWADALFHCWLNEPPHGKADVFQRIAHIGFSCSSPSDRLRNDLCARTVVKLKENISARITVPPCSHMTPPHAVVCLLFTLRTRYDVADRNALCQLQRVVREARIDRSMLHHGIDR